MGYVIRISGSHIEYFYDEDKYHGDELMDGLVKLGLLNNHDHKFPYQGHRFAFFGTVAPDVVSALLIFLVDELELKVGTDISSNHYFQQQGYLVGERSDTTVNELAIEAGWPTLPSLPEAVETIKAFTDRIIEEGNA